MNVQEYKQRLHELIERSEDETLLEEAYRILSIQQPEKDILDELTPAQLAELEKAIDEAQQGKGTPHTEVKKRLDQWISQKSSGQLQQKPIYTKLLIS